MSTFLVERRLSFFVMSTFMQEDTDFRTFFFTNLWITFCNSAFKVLYKNGKRGVSNSVRKVSILLVTEKKKTSLLVTCPVQFQQHNSS